MMNIRVEGMQRPVFTAALALFLAVAGCTGKGEIIKEDSLLTNRANNLYAREAFSEASQRYRQLIEQHPDSKFRRPGIIGLADSLYKDKQYYEAVLYYERFVELYPLDPLTPRAQFYLAMSYLKDTTAMDRDQTNTKKTINALSRFLENYPDHRLASLVRAKVKDMELLSLASNLSIARFYYRINRNQSAIDRLDEFIRLFPDSAEIPEALFMLAECYNREQALKKAAKTYIALINRYPGTEYAIKAADSAGRLKLQD